MPINPELLAQMELESKLDLLIEISERTADNTGRIANLLENLAKLIPGANGAPQTSTGKLPIRG